MNRLYSVSKNSLLVRLRNIVRDRKARSWPVIMGLVSIIAVVGTFETFFGRTLTPTISLEPESTTLSGLTIVNDANASGGQAVQFMAASQSTGTADEIHYTYSGTSQVSFDWRGTATTIRYGLTTSYGSMVAAGGPVIVKENGTQVSVIPNSSPGPFWEARLTGLQASTTYHYSIGGSADKTFHTKPAVGASGFSVAVEGDIGNPRGFSDMQTIQNMIAASNPDMVIAVGDFDYANGSPADGQVDALFGDASLGASQNGVEAFSLTKPFEPSWGNHEMDHANDNGTCTGDNLGNYKGRFDIDHPKEAPVWSAYCYAGGGEDWGWFDYGNTRFISYPEPYNDDGRDWNTKIDPIMADAQANTSIKYIVIYGHRPAWSSGYHEGDTILAGYTAALHAKYSKFFLHLNGHSHNYERTVPSQTDGVTDITVGTGGGDLENGSCSNGWNPVNGSCSQPSWSASRWMRYGYLKLVFGANNITGQFICGPPGGQPIYDDCTQGSVVDTFTL